MIWLRRFLPHDVTQVLKSEKTGTAKSCEDFSKEMPSIVTQMVAETMMKKIIDWYENQV